MTDNTAWHTAAQDYCRRLGAAEFAGTPRASNGRRMHRKFAPSAYLDALCAAMGRNDENGFKATRQRDGRHSALGV